MKMIIQRIDDLDLDGRRVLIRVDFNVPVDKASGEITDDTRIRAALPTIEKVQAAGGRVILASHFGRPKGKEDPAYSLVPVGARLAELTGQEVLVPDDCIGQGPRRLVQALGAGQILLLENLRFHAEEEANDEAFARQLASLCDVYINDAFGAAHRAHASVDALPRLVPERAAGLLVMRELEALRGLVQKPKRPYVALVGGAKVSDKIGVLEALLSRCDAICVGGAMAYTLLAAKGVELGKSLIEPDRLGLARRLLKRAELLGVPLHLPSDHVAVSEVKPDAEVQLASNEGFPEEKMAVDIGPITTKLYAELVRSAQTVFWNGPMGIFEIPAFAKGTFAVAQACAESEAMVVVGGGDSVAALNQSGLSDRVSHASTGGGAALRYIEGRELPGVEALKIRKESYE